MIGTKISEQLTVAVVVEIAASEASPERTGYLIGKETLTDGQRTIGDYLVAEANREVVSERRPKFVCKVSEQHRLSPVILIVN
jgi:hypothetical protein